MKVVGYHVCPEGYEATERRDILDYNGHPARFALAVNLTGESSNPRGDLICRGL